MTHYRLSESMCPPVVGAYPFNSIIFARSARCRNIYHCRTSPVSSSVELKPIFAERGRDNETSLRSWTKRVTHKLASYASYVLDCKCQDMAHISARHRWYYYDQVGALCLAAKPMLGKTAGMCCYIATCGTPTRMFVDFPLNYTVLE